MAALTQSASRRHLHYTPQIYPKVADEKLNIFTYVYVSIDMHNIYNVGTHGHRLRLCTYI